MLAPAKNSKFFFIAVLIAAFCISPAVLMLFGVNFGISLHGFFSISDLLALKSVHLILVSLSVPIAFLTVVLAFVDYSIKKDVSVPIVGVALFCSGLLDTFHVLAAANLIRLDGDQDVISQFTWVISRTFQALILMMGTGLFLLLSKKEKREKIEGTENFVLYISIIFVLLSFLTVNVLFSLKVVPDLYYLNQRVSRPFDLIPVVLNLISGIFIFPTFYRNHPTRFSQTLVLSLIPAIIAEVHMSLSKAPYFDSNFNIAHFLQVITYLVPFIGLSLNYLETHRNERKVIAELDDEIKERLQAEELIKGIYNSSLSGIIAYKAVRGDGGELLDFELMTYNRSSSLILTEPIVLRDAMPISRLIGTVLDQSHFIELADVVEFGKAAHWEHYVNALQKWLYVSFARFGDGLIMTFTDVSARKRAELELFRSEKMALTGRFARTIAHEIRNPLTNITLAMGQLKSELDHPDDEIAQYFDIVKRNCIRINSLITELLNSTKSETLSFMPFSITNLVNDTLELAQDRLSLNEVTLEKEFGHQSDNMMVDPGKMKIALLNIVINAVEAMAPGTGRLAVYTRETNRQITIGFKDNGCGISAHNLPKLFEPFYTEKPKGAGLGLTSAQNIITSHKGTISVESHPGSGTEFQISFLL